ncbi:MAG: YkgJ family cysteine cluster protein [Chloroflexi bacterium]|nr:YkgJ family cysteine cluster protein [Chloroflexota bacterium]
MGRTDKAICSSICGARCCKWGFVELTQEEAERLPRLARELHLPQPEIVAYERNGQPAWIMHATPCLFLNKSNLCGIYKDRPEHCRIFPDTWREWCPLSRQQFADLAPLPVVRTSEDRRPRRTGKRTPG